jgi:hypothetical protein
MMLVDTLIIRLVSLAKNSAKEEARKEIRRREPGSFTAVLGIVFHCTYLKI